MRIFTLAAMAVSAAAFGLGAAAPAASANTDPKISGPYAHDNLTVFFLHGPSAAGPVPLTLAEALAKGGVQVRETGSVNNLEIENTGDREVFIQAGDIVKGGQQDRVLTVSMLLPAKSGKVPIGSFCVEQGRWAKRGSEDVKNFASANEALPSKAAKLAMRAPLPALPQGTEAAPGARIRNQGANLGSGDETSRRQKDMWSSVADVQAKLSANLGAPVAAAQSASSLQLSLENDRVKTSREAYVTALSAKADANDIVGYVVAINGRINSADQYPSNGLFQKMWPKQLAAAATEALGEVRKTAAAGAAPAPPPPALSETDVTTFIAAAQSGKGDDKAIGKYARQELKDGDRAIYVEARKTDGGWVHRSYLAK